MGLVSPTAHMPSADSFHAIRVDAQGPEVIYADIYDLSLTTNQEEKMSQLLAKEDEERYVWVTEEEIMKLGVMNPSDKTSKIKTISTTAQWIV